MSRFTHAPAQFVNPTGQLAAHTPFAHAGVEPEHSVPQLPQLSGSDDLSTHAPPHTSWPAGHAHWPSVHACDAPHLVPQLPQLSRSLSKSTQVPPQKSVLPGQLELHVPPRHAIAVPHDVEQSPQCFGSVVTFTHWPSHVMPGVPSEFMHAAASAFTRLLSPHAAKKTMQARSKLRMCS